MSLCKYAFYNEKEKYYPRLYCRIDNKVCYYTKRCMKVERFVPIEDNIWEECGKYIMEKRKEIPNESYFVQTKRFNKQGNLLLYVAIDDKVERIETDLKELNQEFVYLKKTKDGYKVSLEPFKKNDNLIIHINEEVLKETKEERKKGNRKKKESVPVVEIEPSDIEEDE